MITRIIRWLARHELTELEYALAMERARTAELTNELREWETDNATVLADNEKLERELCIAREYITELERPPYMSCARCPAQR